MDPGLHSLAAGTSLIRDSLLMTKRGAWRLPFLPNCRIVTKARQLHARLFERLAPQKWCVQFWCSSKPGGVMFPPELAELTSCLYSWKLRDAREKLANPDFVTQAPHRLSTL